MRLLRDEELIVPPAHPGEATTVRYIAGTTAAQIVDYTSASMVQACSVDLHIGNIYLPGKNHHDAGGVDNPKHDHVLQAGETAMISTQETINLPNNVAAIGFPPSKDVSSRGLLMTNPGHVDPGYQGTLSFTVINMGKDGFPLQRGKCIVTLLLFEIDDPAHAGWLARHNNHPPGVLEQTTVNRLSSDFVDVKKRAEDIASSKVKDAQIEVKQLEVKWGRATALVGAAFVLIAAAIGPWISGIFSRSADIDSLKNRVEVVETRTSVDSKIQDLDNRLRALENAPQKNTKGQGTKKGEAGGK
jgi:dCTP deaminase